MLKDIIKASRSYRSFDRSVRIEKERLLSWIDTARMTPSTMNRQAIKYKVCHTDEECARCRALVRFGAALPNRTMPPEGHEPTAYIIIAVDKDIAPNYTLFFKDTGIVAQTIMLLAAEEGFGGCMLGSGDPEAIAKEFSLPESIVPTLVLALGRPDEQVELCEVGKDGKTAYFRDESNTHFVPKRPLVELLL